MKKSFLMLPAIFFIADRVVKYFAPSINIEGGFVKFGFYKNYAGAFSLPIGGWLYNIAGIILLVIFLYLFYVSLRAKRSNLVVDGIAAPSVPLRARNDSVAYALILFGGISNMADRFALGYTIDYVNFMNFSFFNIADGMIIIGIVTLLHCFIAHPHPTSPSERGRNNNETMKQ